MKPSPRDLGLVHADSAWAILAACAIASCAQARGCASCEDETEEREEQDLARDHFWRARVEIEGAGRVRTLAGAFDCTSDGETTTGLCGPSLLRFKELAPPMMEAIAAKGWRFARWESSTQEPDGAVRARRGPAPDGRLYVNGFGYSDTGELETVRAIFVRDGGGE